MYDLNIFVMFSRPHIRNPAVWLRTCVCLADGLFVSATLFSNNLTFLLLLFYAFHIKICSSCGLSVKVCSFFKSFADRTKRHQNKVFPKMCERHCSPNIGKSCWATSFRFLFCPFQNFCSVGIQRERTKIILRTTFNLEKKNRVFFFTFKN